jgi:hypothetical protein
MVPPHRPRAKRINGSKNFSLATPKRLLRQYLPTADLHDTPEGVRIDLSPLAAARAAAIFKFLSKHRSECPVGKSAGLVIAPHGLY